jgi:hypothetical protein
VIYVYLDQLGEKASHWGWLGSGKAQKAKTADPKRPPSGAAPMPAE